MSKQKSFDVFDVRGYGSKMQKCFLHFLALHTFDAALAIC